MELRTIVEAWKESEDLEGELVHLETLAERPAIHADLDPPLPGALIERLRERGIERLFRHQVNAIEQVRAGTPTVLVSGTASGKSLCYQVPIAETVLADPKATALLLFPTKALAQDQLRALTDLRIPGLVPATYDGDTDPDQRRWVRRHANVVLTNPDMLHIGILPNHGRWADFMLRLRYVVVDEMHVLRGIFGSHVAQVLRRLRRVAGHYGSDPTLVFASATIGNPGTLAAWLSAAKVEVVAGDDSPNGEKLVVLWNPPLDDPSSGTRRSALTETTDLFVDLVRHAEHTIVFARSRKAAELIYRWSRERLDPDQADRIAVYRGGYLAADRRRIERDLFERRLLGVAATNALELGIDVAGLDAAIIATFPGTIASFWQQAGRAGRTQRQALAVLVGGADALDQYFMAHPDELFARPPEPVVVNPDNPLILAGHLACAAYELPLVPGDREHFGDDFEETATELASRGDLRLRDGKLFWARKERPAGRINIRSSGGEPFTVIDVGAGGLLGTVDDAQAFSQVHPGAVYLHQGYTYLVEELDLAHREARVREASLDYYTQPKEDKYLEIRRVDRSDSLGRLGHYQGIVRVESHVIGFRRKRLPGGELLGLEPLDLPARVFDTHAFWLTVPDDLYDVADIPWNDVPGTLHAAEHAGIAMLPLFAICDRWDIGGLSIAHHPETGMGTIFIYDGYPGGAGIAPLGYEAGEGHLRATMEAMRACPCEAGCPSCVQSPKCGNFNDPLSKHGAIALLRVALD